MKYKNNLFQYDQNQTITNVDGLFVDYILNDETLRVPVVDGNAIIPNEVLAVAGMHYAYVCLANETRLEFRFKVTARVAPPDVPYAPSHAITFDDLVKTVQDEVKSLEERAASGEFDGKDGQDYVITPADYDAIAERVTLEGVVKTVNHVAPDADGNVDVQGGGETTDVKLNGVSITKDGVANIPVAGETLGVVKVQSNGVYGIESVAGGHVAIKTPTTKEITDRAPYKAVTLEVLDDAVSTSLNKPKKSSGSIDMWASARKNMKAQTEFTAGTNLEWVEEQTTLGKKYTLNAAGYDDTEIKGQIEALDGSVVKTVNGVAPVDGNVDVPGGGSSVTMSDNAQGGVDLTVDGSTKTLAKEGELATIKADLSQLATKTATSDELGLVKVSSSYGLGLIDGTIFSENLLPVSYNSKNNYTVISKGTLENRLAPTETEVDDHERRITVLEEGGGEVGIDLVARQQIAEVKDIEGIGTFELNNMLGTDGNFENFAISSAHWYKAYSDSTATVTDNVLSFNANRKFGSLRHNLSFVNGHKYYLFATVKNSDIASVSINVNTASPLIRNTQADVFQFISDIYIHKLADGNFPFMILDAGDDNKRQTVYVKKCGVIDLTETFGETVPSVEELNEFMHKHNDFFINQSWLVKVPTPKAYENKKILFLGDSITYYNVQDNGWCKYFNEITSPSLTVNVAVSGATWCDKVGTVYDGNPTTSDSTNNVIGNQVEKIIRGKDSTHPNYSPVPMYNDFDVIFIACGTNDEYTAFENNDIKSAMIDSRWGSPLPLDQVDRMTPSGAMRYAFEKLSALYPDARFFYCTPIQSYPSKKRFGEIQLKGDVIKEMARYIPIHAIDTEQCGIYGNREQYSTMGIDLMDGIHPTPSGAKKMGIYNANAFIADYLAY